VYQYGIARIECKQHNALWSVDGQVHDFEKNVHIKNQILLITDFTEKNEGYYQCIGYEVNEYIRIVAMAVLVIKGK